MAKKIKWCAIQPLTGGMYLGAEKAVGCPAEFILSYPGIGSPHKDKEGNLLPDEQRLTKFGKFLRKTSLDEIPEFFNILKGDMSVVGPRPERIEHVEKYSKDIPEFVCRYKVKGGLTGYAQVRLLTVHVHARLLTGCAQGRNGRIWKNIRHLTRTSSVFPYVQGDRKREGYFDKIHSHGGYRDDSAQGRPVRS